MKRLSIRARRAVAALALVSAAGGAVGTTVAFGGHDHAVANPHFACVGVGKIGVCIGPPGN